MLTLYRKYRPQRFGEVIGQEPIVRILTKELATNKVAHAYLFSGPRGVGKTTVARLLAKALNCEKRPEGESEPCGECQRCLAVTGGTSLDVLEIDAASQTGVDNVRENIIQGSRFAPQLGAWKVFIIDEVHMLSGAAFNALLKTLEEPPSHAIFVLATTEVGKVPATVVSRCQRFTFQRPSLDLLVKRLTDICQAEKAQVAEEVLRTVAYLAGGSTRDAESLLGQLLALGLKKVDTADALLVLPKLAVREGLGLTNALFKRDGQTASKLINDLEETGENLEFFLRLLLDLWRELLLATFDLKLASKGLLSQEEIKEFLAGKENGGVREKLRSYLELGLQAKGQLRLVDDPTLVVLLLVAKALDGDDPVPDNESTKPTKSQEKKEEKQEMESKKTEEDPPLDWETIQASWPKLVSRAITTQPSLGLPLALAKVKSVTGRQVTLVLNQRLHSERLAQPKIRLLLETIWQELLGQAVRLDVTIDENEESFNRLLATVGGEVVD